MDGVQIAKLTICRPEVRNAFRPQTLIELADAFDRAREDLSVGVIILTGEGDQAFCSGGDQRVRGDTGYLAEDEAAKQGVGRFHVTDLQVQMRRLPKPIIAMVAGYAIGGGHVLHVVCDLTIAADNARFGQTGPKVGSFDGGFGSSVLSRLVGPKKAKEIWFLCRQYDAQQALDMGLVNTVVPLEELEVETVQWCTEMLRLSPFALPSAEGELPCRRGRARRHPAARPRHEPVLLRRRRGAGRPRGVQGEADSGLLAVPAPSVNKWIAGARPRTLPAAIVPVLVGTACAVGDTGAGHGIVWWRAGAAMVAAIGIQVGTNYANDYSDGKRGTDDPGQRVGPPRLVGWGLATPESVRRAAIASFAVAGVAGLALAIAVSWWLLLVGVASFAAGWLYTGGPRPYGYAGLGEMFVFLFFGVVATVGSTYVQTERITALAVGASVPVGLLATALLVTNNLRDIPSDAQVGKTHLGGAVGRPADPDPVRTAAGRRLRERSLRRRARWSPARRRRADCDPVRAEAGHCRAVRRARPATDPGPCRHGTSAVGVRRAVCRRLGDLRLAGRPDS